MEIILLILFPLADAVYINKIFYLYQVMRGGKVQFTKLVKCFFFFRLYATYYTHVEVSGHRYSI